MVAHGFTDTYDELPEDVVVRLVSNEQLIDLLHNVFHHPKRYPIVGQLSSTDLATLEYFFGPETDGYEPQKPYADEQGVSQSAVAHRKRALAKKLRSILTEDAEDMTGSEDLFAIEKWGRFLDLQPR